MPLSFPAWMTTIASHSVGELFDNIWKTATAEEKAADFGRGYGDEHQGLEILAQVTPKPRNIWEGFILWDYINRTGLTTRRLAKSRLAKLRLFLTSWDQLKENGTATTTVEKKLDDKTTEKTQTVIKVFKPPTDNAIGFIKRSVQIITAKEKEMLKKCEEAIPHLIEAGELPPNYQLTELNKRRCREAGYRELVKYFEAAQLPVMPAPDDGHWTESIDAWLTEKVGADVRPVEIFKAAVVKTGAGMVAKMERDKARMAAAKKNWLLAPVLVPIALFRNLVN